MKTTKPKHRKAARKPQARPAETITARELAELAGVTERRIRQLVNEGAIPKPSGRGAFPKDEAIAGLLRHTRATAEGAEERNALRREQAALVRQRAEQIKLDAARARDEMAPIQDQAKALQQALWAFSVAIDTTCRKIALQLHPELGKPFTVAYEAMTHAWRNALSTAAVASIAGECNLPDWARIAMQAGADTGLSRDEAGDKWRREVLVSLMAAQSEAAFIDQMRKAGGAA